MIIGGYPRLPGMERKNLIEKNAEGSIAINYQLDVLSSTLMRLLALLCPFHLLFFLSAFLALLSSSALFHKLHFLFPSLTPFQSQHYNIPKNITHILPFLSSPLGMREQGLSLDRFASKDCKVLVVANPANTNMLVLLKTVKNIPKKNFTCLTRLDEERLRFFVADKINRDLNNLEVEEVVIEDDSIEGKDVIEETALLRRIVRPKDVKNVFIFGNHSTTQVLFF